MCGIVGYVRSSLEASDRPLQVCLAALKRLEYRGYDSAGIALAGFDSSNNSNIENTSTIPGLKVQIRKKAGRLENLRNEIERRPTLPASSAIAHTRWATHGAPSDSNAHPHSSNDARIALIHNGIIENAKQIREDLEAEGIFFTSSTDTEVATHLLRKELNTSKNIVEAMGKVAKQFKGTFTLLAIDAMEPDLIVGARHDSPLVVGLGDGENFLGSDVVAFVDYTKEAIELGQDSVVALTPNSVKIYDFDGNETSGKEFTINWDASVASKGGYETFMEKEIREEPKAVADTLLGRFNEYGKLKLDQINISIDDFRQTIKNINKIIVVACGTASYAGYVAKYAIEHWCRIPVEVELAHEFRYRDPILNKQTLVVAISQSGETMDTLMAIRHAKEQGGVTVAIVNTQSSTIARESDAVLYTHAGPEVAVASTKAFVAQITASYLLGLYISDVSGVKYKDEIADIIEDLREIPEKIQNLVDQFSDVEKLAKELVDVKSVLFLGRHVGYPVAMEGALKLKELAYIHAEGFAAGELKHGPIALIEQDQIVFVVIPPISREELHSKVISNIQEIQARGAKVVALCEENDEVAKSYAFTSFVRPKCPTLMTPLLDVIPLQIFAYSLAKSKNLDVDQPRNLAKSVTVE